MSEDRGGKENDGNEAGEKYNMKKDSTKKSVKDRLRAPGGRRHSELSLGMLRRRHRGRRSQMKAANKLYFLKRYGSHFMFK